MIKRLIRRELDEIEARVKKEGSEWLDEQKAELAQWAEQFEAELIEKFRRVIREEILAVFEDET